MSLLHRSLLAQIMTAIDPIIEIGLTVVNPLAGAGSRVVLGDLEKIVSAPDATAPVAPQAPTQTLPTGFASPVPAAAAAAPPVFSQPVATGTTVASSANVVPAPAPLTAQDVIAALMQTLQALSARA